MGLFYVLSIISGVVTILMAFALKVGLGTRVYYVLGGIAYIVLGIVRPGEFSVGVRIAILIIPIAAIAYGIVSMIERRSGTRSGREPATD